MLAVDVCDLPETGGSTFVVVAGLFVLVAGVIVARWVRASAGRLSVVVAPLVLLGGLVLSPLMADPCAPTTTVAATTTTTVATTTTTTVAPTTTVAATTTTVATTTTTVAATTTTVAATTTTTFAPALYNVGNTGPGGGKIFYVDMTRAAGSQYWEAACAGWQNGCDGTTADPVPVPGWGCYSSVPDILGAEGTAIGTGQQNTTDILNPVTGCADTGIAAELADAYSNSGQSDWFLPSKDELNLMYDEQTAIGGFSEYPYWSSSEFSGFTTYAQYQRFPSGYQDAAPKYTPLCVRPVRAF